MCLCCLQCGKQRPECQRCQDDGKTCEGYERWSTFINRTPSAGGLQTMKRERLEEAIIPQMKGLSTTDKGSKSSNRAKPAGGTSKAGSSRSATPSRSTAGPSTTLVRHLDAPPEVALPLLDSRLLQRFLDLYLPASEIDREGGGGPLVWMPVICQLAEPAPVLRLALYSLAASRVAYADGDAALEKESLRCYGETLRQFQRILGGSASPQSKASDEVLMACQCLMIFEVPTFPPPLNSSQSRRTFSLADDLVAPH